MFLFNPWQHSSEILLTLLEFSPIAKRRNPEEGLPPRVLLVEASAGLVLCGVSLYYFIAEPHVRHGHPVLSEGPCLVRANGGCRAESLHSLEILDEAVLGGHSLCSQSQAHRDGGKETLWHVSHNNANEKDDGVEPVVAEDEGNYEEGDPEEDCNGRDEVDEVGDLLGYGSLSTLQAGGQASDAPHLWEIYHIQSNIRIVFIERTLELLKLKLVKGKVDTNHGVVSDGDHDARGRALHRVGGEEREVLGLLWVVVGAFGGP